MKDGWTRSRLDMGGPRLPIPGGVYVCRGGGEVVLRYEIGIHVPHRV